MGITQHNEAIKELKSKVVGAVGIASDPWYDEARTVWNAMIDRKPAIIVRCKNPQDVAQAIRTARTNKMVLSVRGGGHNIAGNAVCDGGLMIDLSQMKTVRIDQNRRVAHVEPGATLGEMDRAAQKFGLATPLGINSTTGVAGLTLGGGFGWLSRRLGLSIDNLLSADVVTPKGELVKASETENSDLFWGIRGGGGNFGVVTSFEFRLHEIGPQILAGLIIHPLSAAGEVLRFYRDFMPGTPEEFSCWSVLRKAPPIPVVPEEWHGKHILALAVCYSGKIDEGEKVARPLRSFGKPIADLVAPHQYTDWQMALDPLLTPGMRNYWKTHDFVELSDGLIDVLLEYAKRIPDPQTEIACANLGGAVSRVPARATAYTHRDAEFVLNVHGRWEDPAKDSECIGWARDLFKAAAPFATGGAYVNFMTEEEHDRVRSAYGVNYDRLSEVKRKYDPENLFRMNQNIKPQGI